MASRVAGLIDPKTLRIVRLFLNNPEGIFHLQKISKESQVPLGSTFRLMKTLSKQDIIQTIPVGKLKIYKLNKKCMKEMEIIR